MKRRALALALVWFLSGSYATAQGELPPGCLHAVTTGSNDETVKICPKGDPRQFANNPQVRAAANALGIRLERVRFWGCDKQPFAAFPDRIDGAGDYVISYPSDYKGDLTTPLLHELAHIMQMEDEGGQQKLRARFSSIRIELGADYLAGVVYAKLYPEQHINVLAVNLQLTGLYHEKDFNAHGTPSQRDSAFRFGALLKPDQIQSEMSKMSTKFQRDVYGIVKGM